MLLLICLARSSAAGSDPSCSQIVNDFKRDYGKHVVPTNLSEAFYFFLHVPRTAGKTYSQCFLRAAVKPSLRCSPSYDFLRLNISQPGCRYITSHDDYSLMDVSFRLNAVCACMLRMPDAADRATPHRPCALFMLSLIRSLSIAQQLPENSAVITQLRNPVNRVVSAYEFAIEVAARRIHLDDNDFARQQANTSFVNTLNVWPWSHLVPFFREDMLMRVSQMSIARMLQGLHRETRRWCKRKDAFKK